MDENKSPFGKLKLIQREEISKTNNQGKTVIIFVLAFKGTNPFLMDKNSKKNSKVPTSDETINSEGIKRFGGSCSQNFFQSKRD